MIKKNQMMITALAIMIAVAGYLNFAGTKVTDEDVMSVNGEITADDMGNIALNDTESDYEAFTDLSEEDVEQASEDIDSLDMDVTMSENGGVDEELEEALAEEEMEDVPGEAVFTSSGAVSELSGAKMQKEQTRAQNKNTLLEIINNANISETQKQEAVNSMISMTDIAEKETAAEILLEAKGFEDAIVSIDGDSVDVVVNTGVSAESVIISTVSPD